MFIKDKKDDSNIRLSKQSTICYACSLAESRSKCALYSTHKVNLLASLENEYLKHRLTIISKVEESPGYTIKDYLPEKLVTKLMDNRSNWNLSN